ncbi:actin-related protein Arp6 [Artomyces pyxidatus]|uniref:Actin-related protein Arp6 n=1 Tax=Artomyces pyxidatus TaxID=48021 RepID=A0ACB8SMK6_9AGAM|nr:actin-related protein Arp6 [Artomyces pyxidatus]
MGRTPVVVLDNGASTIKLGVSNAGKDVRVIPNAIIRSKGDKTTYFGEEFEACRDFSSLNYRLPFEKGYLVDWDAQKAIWDGIFSEQVLRVDPTAASLLITEPYFNLPGIQEVYDQFVFEEYEFLSYYRCSPAALIPHGQLFSIAGIPSPECMLIVDSGFSFTHVIPIMDGAIVWPAVKRIDVGGKLLTNQLKELVSFRQWNMMDETHIMNDVKESCCYVTSQFAADIEATRANPKSNTILQEYILPDFSLNKRGRIRKPDEMTLDSDQILYMNNERFSVPEILFRPDDIGLPQSGIGETIAQSIALLPDDIQGMFWANIGLIGGNTKFHGFSARLLSELRPLAPVDCEIVIYESKDAILEAYRSAVHLAKQAAFSSLVVTREEYQESGSNACRRKFKDWRSADKEKDGPVDSGKGKASMRRVDEKEPSPPPSAKPVRTRTRTVSAVKRR